MYRPFQTNYSDIPINTGFAGKERCLRHELEWQKEPTNAYLSLVVNISFSTHPEIRSISFLLPHSHILPI